MQTHSLDGKVIQESVGESPALSLSIMARPFTRKVILSMFHASANGRQPKFARYEHPDIAAPRASRRNPTLPRETCRSSSELLIFIASGELDQASPAEAEAVAARLVPVAKAIGVDAVSEFFLIVSEGRCGRRGRKYGRKDLGRLLGGIIEILEETRMKIRYHVELSEAERCELTALMSGG